MVLEGGGGNNRMVKIYSFDQQMYVMIYYLMRFYKLLQVIPLPFPT